MNLNWNALLEATKEPLRLLVLAVIPFLLAYLTETNYEWATIATVLLRYADKFLHEMGKEEGKEVLLKGLTRF